jgi:putative acetyltransferase
VPPIGAVIQLRGGAAGTQGVAVLIRREGPRDAAAIHEITVAAFARPVEAALVDELRDSEAWIPVLSMVAVESGVVVGHVLCTRGHVGGAPVLALGPLTVRPDRQRAGVGSALMHAVLGAGDALGEPLVALLGDPRYYRRFGFRLSGEYQITPPVASWQPHFQVRLLTGYRREVRGTFRYAEPFDRA